MAERETNDRGDEATQDPDPIDAVWGTLEPPEPGMTVDDWIDEMRGRPVAGKESHRQEPETLSSPSDDDRGWTRDELYEGGAGRDDDLV